MYIFFSSTTLAGGQACRSKEIERDLETKSKRGHPHLGLTYVTTPSLLALLWPLSGLLTLPRPSALRTSRTAGPVALEHKASRRALARE